MNNSPFARGLAYIQSFIYLATGLWPLFDIESFMLVTGPKEDLWLVRTVGLLITATGATLLISTRRRELSFSIVALACMNALFLAGVDVFYSLSGVISKVYLLDAVLEVGLVFLWILVWLRSSNHDSRSN